MSRKFYCSECARELIITRMAIPKRAIIVDLVEPHECGDSIDLEKHFSKSCGEVIEFIDESLAVDKSVQKSNELDALISDRRSKSFIRDDSPEAPLNILDKIAAQLKGQG